MSQMIPMVVVVPARTVAAVDRITDERWESIPADARRDLDELMAQNGWTRWGMIAGSIITAGVRE